MECKSINTDAAISNLNTDMETCKMNLALFKRSCESLPGWMYEGKFILKFKYYNSWG